MVRVTFISRANDVAEQIEQKKLTSMHDAMRMFQKSLAAIFMSEVPATLPASRPATAPAEPQEHD
jgi:hypothetical protein